MEKKNKFLIVVDGSYFSYYVLFGAVREFEQKYEQEAHTIIKPLDECDQDNLPDLLNNATFVKVLKKFVMKRLETIDYIAKDNFQTELDIADGVDVLFALDDSLKNSFRLALYPQYKAQRTLVKRQYKVYPIKDYVINVLLKDFIDENKYGYHLVKVDGAEGDDVIATALTKLKDKYMGTMLIASDHDFLQIDGIREFDLFGKEARRDLGGEEVSAADYLLGKILMGDKSDNIKQVFNKCGPKTALKLVKNKDALKNMLNESEECSQRFLLNKKMISFNETPPELVERVLSKLNEALYSNDVLNNRHVDLRDFMTL